MCSIRSERVKALVIEVIHGTEVLIYCVFVALSKFLNVNAQPTTLEMQEVLDGFVNPILEANEDKKHLSPVSLRPQH